MDSVMIEDTQIYLEEECWATLLSVVARVYAR